MAQSSAYESIDPKKTYTLYAIVRLGVMGMSVPTVKANVLRDMGSDNILKTEIEQAGVMSRYRSSGRTW